MFAQIYVYDPNMAHQAAARATVHPEFGLDVETVAKLQAFLMLKNPFAKIFKNTGDVIREEESRVVLLVLHEQRNTDLRTNNLPTANEVAVIIVDNEYLGNGRDIVLRTKPSVDPDTGDVIRTTLTQTINEFYDCYDGLHYPLILFARRFVGAGRRRCERLTRRGHCCG